MNMSILIGAARVAVTPDISGFGADLKAKIQAEARGAGDVTVPVQFNVDDASIAKVRAALGAFGGATVPVQFDIDPGSVAKARAAMGLLGGDTAPVKFDVDPASIARARAELGLLGGETAPIEVGVDPASITKVNAEIRAGLAAETVPVDVRADPASIDATVNGIRAMIHADFAGDTVPVEVGADAASVAKAKAEIQAQLDSAPEPVVHIETKVDTGALVAEATAAKAATAATSDLAGSTDTAGRSALLAGTRFGFLGAQIPLFAGAASISVLHLLIDSVVEFGAVAVPAFGAAALGLGAFALVANTGGGHGRESRRPFACRVHGRYGDRHPAADAHPQFR